MTTATFRKNVICIGYYDAQNFPVTLPKRLESYGTVIVYSAYIFSILKGNSFLNRQAKNIEYSFYLAIGYSEDYLKIGMSVSRHSVCMSVAKIRLEGSASFIIITVVRQMYLPIHIYVHFNSLS